jgi:hypothetical protein
MPFDMQQNRSSSFCYINHLSVDIILAETVHLVRIYNMTCQYNDEHITFAQIIRICKLQLYLQQLANGIAPSPMLLSYYIFILS